MFSVPNGKPGVMPTYLAVPRELFAANRQFAQFVAGPVTIDGFNSSNPENAPYTWALSAGSLMGRVTSTGKYASAVIGATTAAYAHAGGTPTTVMTDLNTIAEINRRLGGAGGLTFTGPATAGGTVATMSVAYAGLNLATGAITLTAAAGADLVAGSLIQPTDGSQAIVTLICDAWGVKVADQLGATRVDVQGGQLLAAGGTLNVASIVNYPVDPSLRAWLKAAIRVACPGVNFSDDFA
jgi:hypothetical protein